MASYLKKTQLISVLLEFTPIKPFIWNYLRVFKFFEDLKSSEISGFSFYSIEPMQRDKNDGKFRNPHFSDKWMGGGSIFNGQN